MTAQSDLFADPAPETIAASDERAVAVYKAQVAARAPRPAEPAPIGAVPRTRFRGASVHRGRTFGMTFYNYVIRICHRCGARPTDAGAIAGTQSWAHPCRIEGDKC